MKRPIRNPQLSRKFVFIKSQRTARGTNTQWSIKFRISNGIGIADSGVFHKELIYGKENNRIAG